MALQKCIVWNCMAYINILEEIRLLSFRLKHRDSPHKQLGGLFISNKFIQGLSNFVLF